MESSVDYTTENDQGARFNSVLSHGTIGHNEYSASSRALLISLCVQEILYDIANEADEGKIVLNLQFRIYRRRLRRRSCLAYVRPRVEYIHHMQRRDQGKRISLRGVTCGPQY
jgi:hypothetical protein